MGNGIDPGLRARYYAYQHGIRHADPRIKAALLAWVNGAKLGVGELSRLAIGTAKQVAVYDPYKPGQATGHVFERKWNLAASRPLLLPVQDAAVHLDCFYRENVGRGSGPSSEV